ncbi:MAG: class I adenylate-forming enzyme family protein [Phycisphaerales bacterium]
MSAALLARLATHAHERPEQPAIRAGGATVPYAALRESVSAVAGVMSERTRPGAVVMLASPNRAEFVAAFLGVLAAARVIFPVPAGLPRAELASLAARAGAALLIGDDASRAAMPELSSISLDECAAWWSASRKAGRGQPEFVLGSNVNEGSLYLPSSGTTGLPKIARRSGPSLAAVARNVADSAEIGPNDGVLAAVPMSHSYGMENGLLAPIWAGACIEVCEGFDVGSIFALLDAGRVTALPGVPFLLDALAKLGRGPSAGLRRAWSAGAPLPERVADAFADRFGVRVAQLYGSTEVGSVTFGEAHERGGVGLSLAGVSLRVLDPDDAARALPTGTEGHVAIRSPSMLSGYVDGDAPIVDGHFLTGDLGRIDAAGRLTITGRLKLLVDVGGLKVNPLEVEAALSRHPAVAECAVGPERVSETLTRLRAYVVARPGASDATAADLRAFLRELLASHKIPRTFDFRPALPKSSTGKVLRQKLEMT